MRYQVYWCDLYPCREKLALLGLEDLKANKDNVERLVHLDHLDLLVLLWVIITIMIKMPLIILYHIIWTKLASTTLCARGTCFSVYYLYVLICFISNNSLLYIFESSILQNTIFHPHTVTNSYMSLIQWIFILFYRVTLVLMVFQEPKGLLWVYLPTSFIYFQFYYHTSTLFFKII